MNHDLMTLFVKYCYSIDIYKICPKCGKKNELGSNICISKKCQSDLNVDPVNFSMKIYLKIPNKQRFVAEYPGSVLFYFNGELTSCYKTLVFASGSILHPIMGMTCNEFMFLSTIHGFDTMIYLLSKFFYNSYFLIDRGYDRITRIILLRGSKLNFLNWLSLQFEYGFSYNSPIKEILLRFNDKQEEKKKSIFETNFFQKNTKFFGKCVPASSNAYEFIKEFAKLEIK